MLLSGKLGHSIADTRQDLTVSYSERAALNLRLRVTIFVHQDMQS